MKLRQVTIDHITPLSHGGKHEYSNVQPTHGLCNHIKGNGEFSLERLEEALKRRDRRRSKRYRNTTGKRGVPLTPAARMI